MDDDATTYRADDAFRGMEYVDATPWIYFELRREPDLPAISPGFLGFDLKPGSTTFEQAQRIAAFLSENIDVVTLTKFHR